VCFCCALCQCTQHYDQKEAERYIIESERQWAESVATGDTTVIERVLADDFVGVDPKGACMARRKWFPKRVTRQNISPRITSMTSK